MEPFTTLSALVESYRDYLRLHEATNPKALTLRRFDDRLASCPEAAKTEAVAFEYLRSHGLDPHLLEDPTSGGVDFECHARGVKFAVEATALQDETVSKRSGVENDDLSAGYVDLPATVALLRSRISNKAAQAGRYKGARVLAIGTTHIAGSMLFSMAAAELLTGESKIMIPIGPNGAAAETYMGTELKNAAALRAVDGIVEVFRRKYALVLFLAIHGTGVHVYGLVHPEPEYALQLSLFPGVPIARLIWPPIDRTLTVEWVTAEPKAQQHNFFPIQVTDDELKTGIL